MPDDAIVTTTPREPAVAGRPVVDPACWTGAEMAARTDWIHPVPARAVDDLAAMAGKVRARIGDDPEGLRAFEADDFDLGAFAPTLDDVRHQLTEGRGFAVVRGLPVAAWDRLDLAIAYWGIGRHLGRALSNNPEGDLLGHVTDLGKDYDNPNHRGYQTNAHMLFHCDQCDVVTLLCLHAARSGGRSKIVSGPAVHNEMLRRRPDLVEELTKPMCWTRHGEVATGQKPWYEVAIFNFAGEKLSTCGGYKHIKKGHALPGTPDLTETQHEAFALMATVNEELHLAMEFLPGDIQLLNSHVTMHSRTGYEDWPELERRRHLWRLWLRVPELRPVPPAFANRNQGIRAAATRDRVTLA